MSDRFEINIPISVDDEGMIGRECLECKKYFKVKPGTGLPTDYCHCPYCGYQGDANTFYTQDQLEYGKSIAIKKAYDLFVEPAIKKLSNSFKEIEKNSRNNFIQFKFSVTGNRISFPISYYQEKQIETIITCDNCGLVFSIYGVFARCPDCANLNAFTVFEKSLEVSDKQIEVIKKLDFPCDFRDKSLKYLLIDCISTFDGLGKELRKKKPTLFPEKPNNLFQNLIALDSSIGNLISNNHSDFKFLVEMFQVRHIVEHNIGVIDEDFIKKVPGFESMNGRIYPLTLDGIGKLIIKMRELGDLIKMYFITN